MKMRLAAVSALLIFLSGCASQYFRDAGTPPPEPPRSGRGESLADLTPLVEWVGSTRIKVLEAR